MKKDTICGLDIGTFKICATCAAFDAQGQIDILATQTIPAQGVKAGKIIDSEKLSACLRGLVRTLRKTCGIKVKRVYANVDSPDLRAKVCREKLSFDQKTKDKQAHIEQFVNSTISSNLALDRRVIHRAIYPEGQTAGELKLNIVIVSAHIPTINSYVKSIRDAGLILEALVPSGMAQAQGFYRDFNPERSQTSGSEREKNNFLVDIGAALTKITVFKDGAVADLVILPLGAGSITEALAVRLKLSSDCAEQLKIKYGRVYGEDKPLNQRIIIKDKSKDKTVQLGRLDEIINLKVEELLQELKKALLKLDYRQAVAGKIVVTGGGSILEGFLERAEKALGQPVKMGFLSAVKDERIQAQSALFATSIGLIHYGFKNLDKKGFYAKAKFTYPLMRVLKRSKQLYREYF